jgi:hypothetical protein
MKGYSDTFHSRGGINLKAVKNKDQKINELIIDK